MSNLGIVLTCIFISFIACAIFMSSYKEDQKDKIHEIDFNISGLWKKIRKYDEELNILRARVYDLENKLKEMETIDNGERKA